MSTEGHKNLEELGIHFDYSVDPPVPTYPPGTETPAPGFHIIPAPYGPTGEGFVYTNASEVLQACGLDPHDPENRELAGDMMEELIQQIQGTIGGGQTIRRRSATDPTWELRGQQN